MPETVIYEDDQQTVYRSETGSDRIEWKPGTQPANAGAIRDAARNALAANRSFIASTPTAAQTTAQVKALSRQLNGVIRLLLGQLDGTD